MSSSEREPEALPRLAAGVSPGVGFPKSRRLLRPPDFRVVYDRGFKVPCTCFVAFCWKEPTGQETVQGPRVGFTAPRALGKAVVRNRIRRRVRETVRKRLALLQPGWRIVWNLRRAALSAAQAQIESEIEKVLARCNG